ncbi:hypothetical protein NVP3058O_103 [Vibrio phage 3.058.O._10N.286.46.B8]|nr:hypothetical protein NVP2058O_104 [Vibrio phage 2.058.O._10N.286.46.B8]AUS03173.1 hypothetical protein NVP3058O_103 [Vibrio phage 3.058.O._10N.286.46.B8]
MNYFKNLSEQMILANSKAFHEAKMDRLTGYTKGKANAWNNKKTKTSKNMLPRGKTHKRLERLEWHAMMAKIQNDTDQLKQLFNV